MEITHAIPTFPDSKIHGANMGPIWDRQDPAGPHVGPMNFVIWEVSFYNTMSNEKRMYITHTKAYGLFFILFVKAN